MNDKANPIANSIYQLTKWAVFEPTNESTWARLRQEVGHHLTDLWQQGVLKGETASEAFFVQCDRSVMSQTDIDVGRIVIRVGLALERPAEFVVVEIFQSLNNVY